MIAGTELWRYRGLVLNLAQRELKLRYKRSLLGWLWSLINPAATLLVFMLVFGIFLRVQPPVAGNGSLQSFALFLFTGLVVWNFFSAVVTGSMGWLLASGDLLKKVYFPPESPLFAGALSVLVQTLTEAAILVSVLAIVGNISWTFVLLPVVIVLLFLFAVGLGLIASLLNVYFRDVTHIVSIGTTILFYATPIVYPFGLVPEQIWGGFPIADVIRFNPLTHFVGATRDLLYHLTVPSAGRMAVIATISLGTFALGWVLFRRRAPVLSEEL